VDWIERNGVGLRYELSGEGPGTLVLVHEMGGTLDSWNQVIPLLKTPTKVLRFDTRGAGLSTKVRGTASIDDMTADVAALLDAVGEANPATLVGCAVGAAIALHFAARYAERARVVVAFGPAVGISDERRPAVLAHADFIEKNGVVSIADAELGRAYPEATRTEPERFEKYRARWLANDPGSYAAIYRMLANLDMRSDLSAIRCPTYLFAGIHDALRPPELIQPLASAIAGARFRAIATGHYAPVQTPELVAQLIDEALAGGAVGPTAISSR
jgi:3-oxoadipate enol-lactonase